MKRVRIAASLVPVKDFRAAPSRYLEAIVKTGPVVITVNGKAAGVVLDPAEYDRLMEREDLLAAIGEGAGDADAGRVISSAELRKRLGVRPR